MLTLRSHQHSLWQHLEQIDNDDLPADILCDVVPGGGKSLLPGLLAKRFPSHRIAWFVPRLSLARQAARGLKADFGIDIRESGNDTNPARGTRGFVATHAALTTAPDLWADELRRSAYLLVIDELHHAKLPRGAEANALASAIGMLRYHVRLMMTGTLETNDNSFIYGVPYEECRRGYRANLSLFAGHAISYTRSTALAESAIVPVEFHHHDGPVKWQSSDGVREVQLSEVSSDDEAQAVWTALRTEHAQHLLANCVEHWKALGDLLLVVTADQSAARSCHADLQRMGLTVGLAISDAADAHEDIERFRDGKFKCLVTCQMAYEGLDVPRITHIACLTHIRSTPWILQMLARAWRFRPGKQRCWAFVPQDPRMSRVIDRIREEQEAVVSLPGDGGGEGGKRREGGFVPISGEVSAVVSEMLDGTCDADPAAVEVAELCRRFNLAPSHPIAAQFASVLRVGGERAPRHKTVSEQMEQTRKHIYKACSSADFSKGVSPGTHQKKLYRLLGWKRLADMTLEQLENARAVCARICS